MFKKFLHLLLITLSLPSFAGSNSIYFYNDLSYSIYVTSTPAWTAQGCGMPTSSHVEAGGPKWVQSGDVVFGFGSSGSDELWTNCLDKKVYVDFGEFGQYSCGLNENIRIPYSTALQSVVDSCRTNIDVHFVNPDTVPHTYRLIIAGQPSGEYLLDPGQDEYQSFTVPCTNTTWSLQKVPGLITSADTNSYTKVYTNGAGVVITNTVSQTNSYVDGGQSTNLFTPTPSIYNPGASPSPIIWQNASNDSSGIITAIKNAASALYDVNSKQAIQEHQDLNKVDSDVKSGFDRNHQDLVGISSKLSGLTNGTGSGGGSSNVWVMNWPAGSTNGAGTNVLSLTNYATESTLVGISNLLSRTGTNGTGTNGNSEIPETAKSADAAKTAGQNALGDYGVDGVISSLGGAQLGGNPGEPSMTVSMFGQSIDLNPFHKFPGASSVCITGWTIILILAFLLEVSRLYWNLIHTFATTQTGGVPDLNVLGNNPAGLAVAIATPIIFIALFSAAMAFLFTNLNSSIAQALNISGFLDGMGGIGAYLLCSVFPVNLFFSLIFTRLTLTFSLGKLVAISAAASRFLFGK